MKCEKLGNVIFLNTLEHIVVKTYLAVMKDRMTVGAKMQINCPFYWHHYRKVYIYNSNALTLSSLFVQHAVPLDCCNKAGTHEQVLGFVVDWSPTQTGCTYNTTNECYWCHHLLQNRLAKICFSQTSEIFSKLSFCRLQRESKFEKILQFG